MKRSRTLLLLLLPVLLALPVIPSLVLAAGLFQIDGANVYSGYLEDNDWLVVIEYQNTLQPYYGNATPNMSSKDAFLLQLTEADGTLIAQTPLPAWDYKPGSIYLSATSVASLEWGTNYTVSMYGTDANHNTTNYTLVAADWRGSNLDILDDWCLVVATRMADYYGVNLTTATAEKGDVLNEEGGVHFRKGIPYLDQVRPSLFQIVTSDMPYVEPTWDDTYEEGLPTWDEAVGSDIASILEDTGGLFNLDGKEMGMFFIFLAYVGVATVVFATGHGTAGMVMALPILLLGVYFRFIPFAVMGVGIALAVVFMAREIWWSKT